MKMHFIPLFSPANRRRTIILTVVAALLIAVSLLVGTGDNLPMIVLLLAGLITFFFALLHPWKKAISFAVLTGICLLVLVLIFIFPVISEEFSMTISFIGFAGAIAGIIGIFSRIKGWQRLPITASLISLIALAVVSANLDNPKAEQIAPMVEWLLVIAGQITATLLLFAAGLINKREKIFTKAVLAVATVLLALLCAWGFYASTWSYGDAVNSVEFTILMFRFYGSLEILIIVLTLLSLKKKKDELTA